jgi:hypothetical protein
MAKSSFGGKLLIFQAGNGLLLRAIQLGTAPALGFFGRLFHVEQWAH